MRVPRPTLAQVAPRARLPLAAGLLAACAPATARNPAPVGPTRAALPPLAVGADSASVTAVAEGVTLHRLWFARGPQAVHVLDVDRAACWTLAPRKAGHGAVGRAGTLALVRGLADSGATRVAGGVNADFFLFSPPGVPTGAHVQDGRVIAGPGVRPALAVDSTGAIWMGRLRTTGTVSAGGATLPLDGWNRGSARGLALFDERWGDRTDSLPGRAFVSARVEWGVAHGLAVVTGVDTGPSVRIGPGMAVAALGADADPDARRRLLALRPFLDTLRLAPALAPIAPHQAVGGFPMLVRDGRVDPQVDSAGAVSFRGPNPRTAAGVAANGRRVLLVANDGRQPGYSAGMSLRELAELFVAMGAREAINLDGGGSTTLVVADGARGFRIANRPSDAAGERPVANALAVVRDGCR